MMTHGARQIQGTVPSEEGKEQRLVIVKFNILIENQTHSDPPAPLSSSSTPFSFSIFHLAQPDVILGWIITISHPKYFFSSCSALSMLVRTGVYFGLRFRKF